MTRQRICSSGVSARAETVSSKPSAPVECTTTSPSRARSSFLRRQTPSFMWAAPSEPPKTSSMVSCGSTPKAARPSSRLARITLRRTGLPVSTTSGAALPSRSKTERAAGTEMHTLAAWGASALFASPGTEFCSWSTYGTPWRWQQLSSAIST